MIPADLLHDAAGFLRRAVRSERFEVSFPSSSSLRGSPAGSFLLETGAGGVSRYVWHPAPADAPRPAVAELSIVHRFCDLGDLHAYLGAEVGRPASVAAWVGTAGSTALPAPAVVRVLDSEHPERGLVSMAVPIHPALLRWTRVVPTGRDYTDLTHEGLADLVLEGQEDLTVPTMARYLARFRYVRTVEAVSDREAGDDAVKVTFRGSGGKAGAEESVGLPRDIAVRLPVYTGAWPAGGEPRHEAMIRLRIVPPKGEGSPTFRLSWADVPALQLTASRALVARVREVLGDVVPVYEGEPGSTRYVMPPAPGAAR